MTGLEYLAWITEWLAIALVCAMGIAFCVSQLRRAWRERKAHHDDRVAKHVHNMVRKGRVL